MPLTEGETGADIGPLEGVGVPGFGLWQDTRTYFDDHHSSGDTFDKIDRGELARNVAAMAVLAYAIAERPEPLPR